MRLGYVIFRSCSVEVFAELVVAVCLAFSRPSVRFMSGFLCLLLDQSLDTPSTLGISTPGEITSKAVTSNKKTFNKRINTPIEQHEELIKEFWKGKGGAKSDTAWKLLMTELEKLQKDHGDAVVREQLQLAINGKWKGISATRYEQFKAPKGNAPAQEQRHPSQFTPEEKAKWDKQLADRVAENDRKLKEQSKQWEHIPSMTNGKGVLDGLF